MKTVYKTILFVAIVAIATMFASSCKDDNNSSSGVPYISYVRVTDPASSDSLLAAAGQGQLIAIVGNNLQNTRQVWFNDQEAQLTPTYISKTSVLVSVPTKAPEVVTNQMKLIFANGDSLLYDFTVTISKPVINGASNLNPNGMDCEYVPDGGLATIHGNYFYLPISVSFEGGVTATSDNGDVTVNDNNDVLTVKVPEGAQPGRITITTNFGSTKSDFWFRDNRNIFEGFDAAIGTGDIITDPGASDPQLINGPYKRMTMTIGAWGWTEVFNWVINSMVPDDAILNPSDYYYKFEVNTLKPYNANGIDIVVSDPAVNTGHVGGSSDMCYKWNPPFDTQGEWQTVIIPFEDIMNANPPLGVIPGGYFYACIFLGDGTLDCDMCFDNFRVVPKTLAGN